MRPGICCIVLELGGDAQFKFQKMTFASFSKMERNKALEVLGSRILNNMAVTLESVKYCSERGYCYRLSSDLFPLVTYDKAGIRMEDLPQLDRIHGAIDKIRSHVLETGTRISTHPDQFNVLASENVESLERTVRELNFQSWFMDMIGCPADYNSPINIHVNNNAGLPKEIVTRFKRGLSLLDENCRARLVVENDDKPACWSVRKLSCHLHDETGCPLTFDYLHNKCHPDGLSEEQALRVCYDSWGSYRPLFHYSESRDESNPRAHADYPESSPEMYGLDFDIDFEFKMKNKAVELFESKECLKL